jgi:hypothetical protein
MQAPQTLAGSEMVIAEFGAWPSFHDAEVISFAMQRPVPVALGEAEILMTVHVRRYEPRGEGTASYHLALVKSSLIAFRFLGVEALDVSDFNHQNVIDAMTISETSSPTGATLAVEVQSIFGLGAQWQCRSAEVSAVTREPSEA